MPFPHKVSVHIRLTPAQIQAVEDWCVARRAHPSTIAKAVYLVATESTKMYLPHDHACTPLLRETLDVPIGALEDYTPEHSDAEFEAEVLSKLVAITTTKEKPHEHA